MAVVVSFVAAFLLCFGVLVGLFRRRLAMESRVAAVNQAAAGQSDEGGAPLARIVPQAAGLRSGGPAGLLLRGARRAGVNRLFAARRRVYGALAALLALGWVLRGAAVVLAVAAALAGGAYLAFAARRRARQKSEFEAALPDMLTITSGALRSGYSFLQAVDMLTTETRGRMAAEFRIVLREMTLGVGVEEALTHAAERVQSKDFDLIVDAVLISRQIGGNLAEVLDIVADTIRERMRIQGEVRSLTAQGRMSMWIFLLLTPGITLVLSVLDPSYVSLLWSSPAGLTMLATAVIGQLLGAVIIRKIVRVEI